MGFASNSGLFLTVGISHEKKGDSPFFHENFLALDQTASFQPFSNKPSLLGFHLQQDGLEIYHLFEERWLIVSNLSYWNGSFKSWIEDRFLKAIECIPSQDETICCFIGNLKILEEIILPEIFKKRPLLPFVILFDDHSKSELFLKEKEKSANRFDKLEFETIKDHLLIRGWSDLKPKLPKVMYYHLKK